MSAAVFTAAAEESSAIDPDDFLDWNKAGDPALTTYVTGNITSPYEYEESVITSALYDYTFNFDKYYMSHNLYEILKLGENGGNASFTYILDSRCRDYTVSIKKLESGSYTTVTKFIISSLYDGVSINVEGKKCVLYAYDSSDGYVCVNLSLYDPETEPEFNAEYDSSTHRIKVSATLDKWYDSLVNLALVRKDNDTAIGYIDQTSAVNGNVDFDFKFIYDPADYIVVLNCEGRRYEYGLIDIVDSGQTQEAALAVTADGGTLNASLEANDVFYSVNDTSFIVVAFYGAGGNLISCSVARCWQNSFNVEIPSGTAKAKTFAFESLENITPQAKSAEKLLN